MQKRPVDHQLWEHFVAWKQHTLHNVGYD